MCENRSTHLCTNFFAAVRAAVHHLVAHGGGARAASGDARRSCVRRRPRADGARVPRPRRRRPGGASWCVTNTDTDPQGPASALRFNYYHAAALLPFNFVPAPLGATHDMNATRPTTSTTPPPYPPPTRCSGGPTRAVACEADFFSRVVVVASSSVVRSGRSGTTPNGRNSQVAHCRSKTRLPGRIRGPWLVFQCSF